MSQDQLRKLYYHGLSYCLVLYLCEETQAHEDSQEIQTQANIFA